MSLQGGLRRALPKCGADLNLGPCNCRGNVDPRLAYLGQLLDNTEINEKCCTDQLLLGGVTMAVPKRKVSKARRDKRAFFPLEAQHSGYSLVPKTAARTHLPLRVCKACGKYNGREVLQ